MARKRRDKCIHASVSLSPFMKVALVCSFNALCTIDTVKLVLHAIQSNHKICVKISFSAAPHRELACSSTILCFQVSATSDLDSTRYANRMPGLLASFQSPRKEGVFANKTETSPFSPGMLPIPLSYCESAPRVQQSHPQIQQAYMNIVAWYNNIPCSMKAFTLIIEIKPGTSCVHLRTLIHIA